ncbi:hypothetical protein [Candidatus Harpocratesius sp.]
MVSLNNWLNGISAIGVLLTGVYFGVLFTYLYFKKRKKLLPSVALLGFCSGLFYLGTVVNFLTFLITNNDINPILFGQLSYTLIPVATFLALSLGFSIFKPEWRKWVQYVLGILWVIYWICIFFFPAPMFIPSTPNSDEMLEISLGSVVLVITGIYILSLLFVQSGGFFILRRKLKRNNSPSSNIQHMTFLAIGWALFAIASILDAILPSSLISLVVIARIIMIIGYILIFNGFREPKEKNN